MATLKFKDNLPDCGCDMRKKKSGFRAITKVASFRPKANVSPRGDAASELGERTSVVYLRSSAPSATRHIKSSFVAAE